MGMQEFREKEPAQQEGITAPKDTGDTSEHKIGELTPPSGFNKDELRKEIGTPADNLTDLDGALNSSDNVGDSASNQEADTQGVNADQESRKIGEDG